MGSEATQFDPASFRDPSGSVFTQDGTLYRTITHGYKTHFEQAESSGLYESLIKDGMLISHTSADVQLPENDEVWKVIAPERIDFISYPYEWCFSELQDAALLTLDIQLRALENGMTLKDATAFNVQFHQGKPIFIDTLSFETYVEGAPWQAYRQFCEHFLAPLALMSYGDVRLNQLLRVFLDGVPLELTGSLLPRRSYLSPSLLMHIHLHAKGQRKYEHAQKKPEVKISRHNLLALIDNLRSIVRKLRPKNQKTEWGNYYEDTNYTKDSFDTKKVIISEWIESVAPKSVFDLGANDGEFSRLASDKGINTIAFDIDPVAVEHNYQTVKRADEAHHLPLILDLTNPSPSIGWGEAERASLKTRGPADLVLALALVHHLAISNNIPLKKIAEYFSSLCESLIIEFIPIDDSQVQRLLTTRENIFDHYTEADFETDFSEYFSIQEKKPVSGSKRQLYLMQKKS